MTNYQWKQVNFEEGCVPAGDGVCFRAALEDPEAGVLVYDRSGEKLLRKAAFSAQESVGNMRQVTIPGIDPSRISYCFYDAKGPVEDRMAKGFVCPGRSKEPEVRKAIFPDFSYDWEGDEPVRHRYEDSIWYQLHVKGFTAARSSGVQAGGTFRGLAGKLPYLRDLGITTLLLQPVYEFDTKLPEEPGKVLPEGRINYWGYAAGAYFAPKASYAATRDPVREMRDLVLAVHRAGIELICQFYFPEQATDAMILQVLRFWMLNYHVDGFHLVGARIPMRLLSQDPLLAGCKLLSDHLEEVPGLGGCTCASSGVRRIGLYREDYQYPARGLLKGDEGCLGGFLNSQRHDPAGFGRINFLTSYRGFTLGDLVMYDRKHNEENGEENRDGSDCNCSWNCGEEGPSRKKKVRELRLRQMKNAFLLLMTSAATPMFFMGDEFGNSQKGNNNPYCTDSPLTWLDWKDLEKNRALFDFVKEMIAFRKAHRILHPGRELSMLDQRRIGFPDLSYHGESAWRADLSNYSRTAGLLYCENYEKADALPSDAVSFAASEPSLLYIGLNFHWKEQQLALPKPPKGTKWKALFTTAATGSEEEKLLMVGEDLTTLVPARTIEVYQTVPDPASFRKEGTRVKAGKAVRHG